MECHLCGVQIKVGDKKYTLVRYCEVPVGTDVVEPVCESCYKKRKKRSTI